MGLALLVCMRCAAQGKPTVSVAPDRQTINIVAPAGQTLPPAFVQRAATQMQNYQLHELEPADRPGIVSAERSDLFDASAAPACGGVGCQALTLRFNAPLPANEDFILRIDRYLPAGGALTLRFSTSAAAAASAPTAMISKGPNAYKQLDELLITSTGPINVQPGINVQRSFYRLKNGVPTQQTETYPATVRRKTDQLFVVQLNRKLTEGMSHVLYIDPGITDLTGASVRAEGTVELAGPPKKPEDRRLDVSLASVAATHQKGVFALTANVVPKRIYQVGHTNWLWEPTAAIDVGLRSTKSNNSVVLMPLNFRNVFLEDVFALNPPPANGAPRLTTAQQKDQRGRRPSAWDAWRTAPWYKPSDVEFTVGPKAEFDRNFKRKNLLGSVRFDFNFHRWLATMSKKREILENDLNYGKAIASQTIFNFGWRLVPYAAFDFGGHVNNETVSKKGKSVFVPRHSIFRSYAGLASTFEWNTFALPTTLTIEEALVHLAKRETIGFTTDSGVELRQLRGFHHRSKAALDFAFDPAKHYTFNLTYENGRLAPNFEYLNKLTAGFKVVY
ncbi:MAG: hypothetical protein ACJ74W_04550 [Pyrinomonadaceae bacterium]